MKNYKKYHLPINSVSTPYQLRVNSHSVSVNFNIKPQHSRNTVNVVRKKTTIPE